MSFMFRLSLIAFLLIFALLPALATSRIAHQPNPGAEGKSPFVDLARLELDHDFWGKLLAAQAELVCFGLYCDLNMFTSVSALGPSLFESEWERLRETIKAGLFYIAKEIVPNQFWEEQLAKFYTRVLPPEEAKSIVLLYPDRVGTSAEAQLQQLRLVYFREVLPNLIPQI